MSPFGETLLAVRELRVHFPTAEGVVKAVDGLSFAVRRGETFGIVGESGSGKTVTTLAALGLVDRKTARIFGEVVFEGRNLLEAGDEELQRIRGKKIAMIFQDPFASLHPMYRVGDQLVEAILVHERVPKRKARERAVEMLAAVGISRPRDRFRDYPHQYSGGMRQRAMIAMALACEPKLLIADEPTTALDVTIQAQILDLLRRLVREHDTALVMITHDLGVVAGMCERVNVMYGGMFMETGSAEQLFDRPRHPYTLGLLQSVPRLDASRRARLQPIEGQPPNMMDAPRMCPFAPRCRYEVPESRQEVPPLRELEPGHRVACFNPVPADEWRKTREEQAA